MMKIDLQNWRSKIKDQDQNMKIIGSDLDHTKDQDHLFDLDLSDQDQWSFYKSVPYIVLKFGEAIIL